MLGIIAPSGPLRNTSLEEIKFNLESYGYEVKFSESCSLNYKGYLAGNDDIRARDIEDMFLDKDVDIIMCLRGGYGTTRILDKINYDIIKQNPKPFIGFSDITGLNLAFYKNCGLLPYHGIMAANVGKWDKFTYKSLVNALEFKDELYLENPKEEKIYTVCEGKAEGIIMGGNLSLIIATMGTKYEIDAKDKILLIEEIGEPQYKLDRMLTQLYSSGKLEECNGIIFGDFKDCIEENDLMELLIEFANKVNKPSIYNLQSGHCIPMITIPLGRMCELDATEKIVKLKK
ncbi:TPA: LD-carboxypeptidase [Clostridioides difficile]